MCKHVIATINSKVSKMKLNCIEHAMKSLNGCTISLSQKHANRLKWHSTPLNPNWITNIFIAKCQSVRYWKRYNHSNYTHKSVWHRTDDYIIQYQLTHFMESNSLESKHCLKSYMSTSHRCECWVVRPMMDFKLPIKLFDWSNEHCMLESILCLSLHPSLWIDSHYWTLNIILCPWIICNHLTSFNCCWTHFAFELLI